MIEVYCYKTKITKITKLLYTKDQKFSWNTKDWYVLFESEKDTLTRCYIKLFEIAE